MEQGYREQKVTVNGVPSKMVCHIQSEEGAGPLASAHYHDYIELLYCVEGYLGIWLNGTYYSFRQGDMVLISSNEVHQIEALSSQVNEYIVLRFEPDVLYDSTQNVFDAKYILPFVLNNGSPQKVFTNREICTTNIPSLVRDCLEEYDRQDYGFALAIRSNLCRIFLWILRHWRENGVDMDLGRTLNSELLYKLQEVLNYMAAHYAENLSAADMARMCGMSYSYFSRSFKQAMRRSFNDYLNVIRITEAEKLLMTTDKPITEIALDTGFSSSSYFIRIFHEYKKLSPTQFRRQFGKGA